MSQAARAVYTTGEYIGALLHVAFTVEQWNAVGLHLCRLQTSEDKSLNVTSGTSRYLAEARYTRGWTVEGLHPNF